MKPLTQRPIEFINECNCIVDLNELESAVFWYQNAPTCSKKKIFMYGLYPAVSVYDKKIHVHRLLMMYWCRKLLKTDEHVHHKDSNKLNATKDNLQILSAKEHVSLTHKGRTLSLPHRKKIADRNKLRKGSRTKKRVHIDIDELRILLNKGYNLSKCSKHFKCDWSTIKSRITDNPDLLTTKTTNQ